MRVISGSARGLKLNAPINDDIRPTTDRVKESMFNVISMHMYDSIVLDLFSGSGALGIESLSRGAKEAYFCDKSSESIKILKSNIDKTKFSDSSFIIKDDYKSAIKKLSSQKKKFDIIFVDPPYYKGLFEDILSMIDQHNILSEDGIIVVEHDSKIKMENVGNLSNYKEKKYGITTLSFYGLEEEDE
ncbi:MAG: 16S rRNA (guanine(966)-N(2))-methyltransferase RsmD [Peptostreptococcus sp.]|uniref:16S rRNA (guanine(966)-N(2))-methyltransferase RsmD n=1 Tax=Peptostreptococcus sp. TaxID=1262 RepID=UPI002FCC5EC8